MVTTTFVLGPLALIGVIFTVGLFVAVFGRRRSCAARGQSLDRPSPGVGAFVTALTVVGGLLFCGLLMMAIVALIWMARSNPSSMHFSSGWPVSQSPKLEAMTPPRPPTPPSPQFKAELIESSQSLLDATDAAGGKPVLAEAEESSDRTTATLSEAAAAPTASPETAKTPSALPEWVESGEGRFDGVFRMPIAIGPFPSREDCNGEKAKAFTKAVKQYANEYLEEGAGDYVELPMSYINQNIYRTEAEEYRDTSFGRMVVVHYLLEFKDDVREHISHVYHQALIAERLKYSGLGAAGLLGLLTTVFGYLKLDTLSRGYYTGRLRFAAAAAILGLVAAGLLFVA